MGGIGEEGHMGYGRAQRGASSVSYRHNFLVIYFFSGKSVLKLVLSNAKRVYSNGYDNVFVKSGGFQRAIDDFDLFDSRIKKINKVRLTPSLG